MAVSAEVRAAVRGAFGGRCGDCGVSESFVGGELEIDHVRPQAAGGSDDIENLVYACTTCNRFKGDYAPAGNAPPSLRLLHPGRDDVEAHIAEASNGRLVGITPRGWFHIQRLHLNRAQLIELRRLQRAMRAQSDELARAKEAEMRLRRENSALQDEVARLRAAVVALLGREE
ncbi:MAG TPA: HNH endonuclease signature motif containing protein [Polyangiaceae bacterium]|nr:HNH endonuclease signature motif containing protein [Polyangiaceae bacterium]